MNADEPSFYILSVNFATMANSPQIVALALGSNLGNKLNHLKQATTLISKSASFELLHTSSIYKSKSHGFTSDSFLNNVILIRCIVNPNELLSILKEIEKQLGRIKNGKRNQVYTDRIIDIDIIFYGNISVNTSELIIPHPEATNRNFVLVPLLELKTFPIVSGNRFMETIVNLRANEDTELVSTKSKEYLDWFNACKIRH